jgi:hypothetical protein
MTVEAETSDGMRARIATLLATVGDRMGLPIRGSCLCGAVTYECVAPPVWTGNCHCRACQKLSGAPYVSAFSAPAGSFSSSGETRQFSRTSDAGHLVTTTHCAACGGRMFAQSAGNPSMVNVFAATLLDPSSFTPISNVYLSEAASWAEPPPAALNFKRMPERAKSPSGGPTAAP